MHNIFHQKHLTFKKKIPIGVGYSFIKNTFVSYILTYDDSTFFYYRKILGLLPDEVEVADSDIQEEYIGSDSKKGMESIMSSDEVQIFAINQERKKRILEGISIGDIIEVHYSYNFVENDSTLYLYSKSIDILKRFFDEKIPDNILKALVYPASKYCLKVKVGDGGSAPLQSMIFTSKNAEEGDALERIQGFLSPFIQAKEIHFPFIEKKTKKFYTYEVAFSFDTKRIENFILFSVYRNCRYDKSPL